MVRKSKSFQRKKIKKRSKSPKKKHLSSKRRSPSHHDGGIFTNIYNYIKHLFYIDERRVFPESSSSLPKSTPESSKVTTQNKDTTEVTEESIF